VKLAKIYAAADRSEADSGYRRRFACCDHIDLPAARRAPLPSEAGAAAYDYQLMCLNGDPGLPFAHKPPF
jgi:hypothetical protein